MLYRHLPFSSRVKPLRYALLALMIWGLTRITNIPFSEDLDRLLSIDQHQHQTLEKLDQFLDGKEMLALSMQAPNGIFTPEGIIALHEISERLATWQQVADVKSLTHSVKPIRNGLSFQMVPIASTNQLSPDDLKGLKDYALSNPLMRQVMVSGDAMSAIIAITLKVRSETRDFEPWLPALDKLLLPWTDRGFVFHYLGMPLAREEIQSTLATDITLILPLILLGILTVLWSFKPEVRFLIYLMLQSLLTLSLAAIFCLWWQISLSLEMFILLPVWAVVQWMSILHNTAAVDQASMEGMQNPIVAGLRRILMPSLWVYLTTLIGLLALSLSHLEWIQRISWLGAGGVLLIYLSTFGPGLVWVFWYHGSIGIEPPRAASRLPIWLSRITSRVILPYPKRIMTITLLASCLAIPGLLDMKAQVHVKQFLSPWMKTYQALEHFDQTYGGANLLKLTLDTGKPGGLHQRQILQSILDWSAQIETLPEVTAVYSYPQILTILNQIWHDPPQGFGNLPESDLLLGLFAAAVKTPGFPLMQALESPSGQMGYLYIRTPNLPSLGYLKLMNTVSNMGNQHLPKDCQLAIDDTLSSIHQADEGLRRSLLGSMTACLLALLFLLSLLWLSPLLALGTVVVNALGTLFVMGAGFWLGIELNALTCLVGAMAFGIAIDDGIHLVGYWRTRRREGIESEAALNQALQAKTNPILHTSLLLIVVFLCMTLSSIPAIQAFARLGVASFAIGLAGNLWLLPCWVRITSR